MGPGVLSETTWLVFHSVHNQLDSVVLMWTEKLAHFAGIQFEPLSAEMFRQLGRFGQTRKAGMFSRVYFRLMA